MRLLTSLLVALVVTGVAAAGSCVTPHRVVVTPAHAVVVKKAVVAEVVTVPVFQFAAVPVYGGAYVPPVAHATPPPAAQSSELQQILTAIKQVDQNTRNIDERVKALESKVNGLPAPTPVQPKQPDKVPDLTPKTPLPGKTSNLESNHPGAVVLSNRCASCHNAAVAATEGGNFTMFDGGKMLTLTDRQWRKVQTKMAQSKMPPDKDNRGNPVPPMPQEEYAQAVAFIDSLK